MSFRAAACPGAGVARAHDAGTYCYVLMSVGPLRFDCAGQKIRIRGERERCGPPRLPLVAARPSLERSTRRRPRRLRAAGGTCLLLRVLREAVHRAGLRSPMPAAADLLQQRQWHFFIISWVLGSGESPVASRAALGGLRGTGGLLVGRRGRRRRLAHVDGPRADLDLRLRVHLAVEHDGVDRRRRLDAARVRERRPPAKRTRRPTARSAWNISGAA